MNEQPRAVSAPRRDEARLEGEFMRRAILGEVALATDSPLQLDSRGARLDDATIEGDLDLTAIDFDRPIVFTRCNFEGAISLAGSRLDSFSLRDCRAISIDASGARLHGDLTISGGSLKNPGGYAFNGQSMSVGGAVLFVDDSLAVGAVSLAYAAIDGRVICNGTFRNPLEHVNSLTWFTPIHSAINAFGVRIGRYLAFNSTSMAGTFRAEGFIVLINAVATDGIYLVGGAFTAGTRSWKPQDCDLQGDPATRYAIESGAGLTLHNAQIGELVLSGVEHFEGLLSIRAAKMRNIADDGTLWQDPATGRARHGVAVELDGCSYTAFTNSMTAKTRTDWRTRLEWLKAQLPEHLASEFCSQPFTQCAEVLRKMGDQHGSRMLLFERERMRLRSPDGTLWETITARALGLVAGHGYKSYYALYWALGVWLAGGAVFGVAQRLGEMRPASEHVLVEERYRRTGEIPKDYEPLKPLLYSADILLPIVDIGQERFWLPRDAGERPANAAAAFPHLPGSAAATLDWLFGGWLPKAYYYFEIAMGWILVSIAVAGFSGHLGHKGEE